MTTLIFEELIALGGRWQPQLDKDGSSNLYLMKWLDDRNLQQYDIHHHEDKPMTSCLTVFYVWLIELTMLWVDPCASHEPWTVDQQTVILTSMKAVGCKLCMKSRMSWICMLRTMKIHREVNMCWMTEVLMGIACVNSRVAELQFYDKHIHILVAK